MKCNNATVDDIKFKGDIIPLRWYHEIKQKTEYADLNSIHLLAHIVYYYRPTAIFKDGKLDCYRKKFKRDFLQKSYSDLASSIGISIDQVRHSLKKLEELKLITREYRNLTILGKNLNNLMFIRIHPENILKISDHSDNNELDPIIIAKSKLPDEVIQISKINFSGNIIPRKWLNEIRQNNGKADLVSITLLADLVYWNRSIKGEGEGHKFSKESLQKDFHDLSDKFSLYIPSIKAAITRLEKQGLITVHFKDVVTYGRVIKNVQFIDVKSENILQISEFNTDSQDRNEILAVPDGFFQDTQRNFPRYPAVFSNTNTKITTKDFSKTTTFSLLEKYPKILDSELELNLQENEKKLEEKNNLKEEYKNRAGEGNDKIIHMLNIWESVVWKNPLTLTKGRKNLLQSLLTEILENDIEKWKILCQKIVESDFLSGKITQFKASIDWIAKKHNAVKVLEGNYDNIIKLEQKSNITSSPTSPEWIRYMMTELKKPKGSKVSDLTQVYLPLELIYESSELIEAINSFKNNKGFVPTLEEFQEYLETKRKYREKDQVRELFAVKISQETCEIKRQFLESAQYFCKPVLLDYIDKINISFVEKASTEENNCESKTKEYCIFHVPNSLIELKDWENGEEGWESIHYAMKYFAHRIKVMDYIVQQIAVEGDTYHNPNNNKSDFDGIIEKFRTSFLMSTLLEFMNNNQDYTQERIKEYVNSRLEYLEKAYGLERYNWALGFFSSEDNLPSLKEFEEFFEDVTINAA